jgi:lipoprotein-releasing system permease protein
MSDALAEVPIITLALSPLSSGFAVVAIGFTMAAILAVVFGGAYRPMLALRYLRRKLIPLFALLAVMLCVAMVIIVSSVMGGFLDMVSQAGKSVMGDVVVYAGVGGFGQYDDLIQRIEATDEADAATAVITAYGLLKIPVERTEYVQVVGIDGPRYAQVTDYTGTLFWSVGRISEQLSLDIDPTKFDPMREGVSLHMPGLNEAEPAKPGIVPGLEISPYNYRTRDGDYQFNPSIIAMDLLLTVLPVSASGGPVDPSVEQFTVVNEFMSGFFAVDSRRVYVPFDTLQRMMLMDEAPKVDPADPTKVIGTVPARCSEVHISAAEGVSAEQLRQAVEAIYKQVAAEHPDMPSVYQTAIVTWQQRQREYLAAIEHEKGLLTVLFGVISLVAVVMIAVIFYMIVLEKTRDIGILRSIGASRMGIASVFLIYGGVIGVLGTALGTGLAFGVVAAINEIHAWLGTGVGATLFGVMITMAGALIGAAIYLPAGAIRRARGQSVGDVLIDLIGALLLALLIVGGFGLLLGVVAEGLVQRAAAYAHEQPTTPLWFIYDGLGRTWDYLESTLGLPMSVLVPMLGHLAGAWIALALLRDRVGRWLVRLISLGGLVVGAVILATGPNVMAWFNDRFSVVIWDRSVYFFDRIPSKVDPAEVLVIVFIAVVASILGALVPAIKAARLDPIEALRYE